MRVNVPQSWSSGFPLVGKQDEQEGQKLDNQSLVGAGAVVVYTLYVTQRKRDQTQNKTEYKEGEYVGDSDDNSSGQQLVHSLGCARQDQRLRYQLPPVRPQGFQVRRCQGEADGVRRGQVQDKEMPGWVKCPDSTWQLLP